MTKAHGGYACGTGSPAVLEWPELFGATADAPLALLLVESNALMREGFRALLARLDFLSVAAEASSGEEALKACRQGGFDMALIGGGLDEFDLTRLTAEAPGLLIVHCYDQLDSHEAAQWLQAGVRGLVSRAASPEKIVEALRQVAKGGIFAPDEKALQPPPAVGGCPLSTREAAVLALLAQGYSNKDVANRLNLSVRTVETHRFNLRRKSGASRRHELQRLAQQLGLTASVETGRLRVAGR